MRLVTSGLCLIAVMHTPAYASRLLTQPGTDQLIIRLKPKGVQLQVLAEQRPLSVSQTKTFSALAGTQLAPQRITAYGQVVKLSRSVLLAEADDIAKRIASSPDVMYAEPDKLLFPFTVPNDSLYEQQWNLHSPAMDRGGLDLPGAWDLTTGASNVVVAVVDSGILNHADLSGRVLPGYDFVSDVSRANDGDGRDSDPTDPGDWVTSTESTSGALAGCEVGDSKWHGTHVAGTIGAATNNNVGIAGIGWGTRILPVRAMGKCGGYVSDITDGMRWAAGLPVAGAPVNYNPAKVINLSLGGGASCSITEQSAIDDVVAAGATVVVAAGNEARNAATVSPANCNHVIAVAATDRSGARASYTNYGSVVDVSAPGGDLAYGGGGILSTSDGGMTRALHDNAYKLMQGTSVAAPHVSGVASLLLSANSALPPSSVEQILVATSRAFPTGTSWDCNVSRCGAGIVDAAASVNVAKALVNATAGQFLGIPSGDSSNLSLVAAIQPRPEDLNKTNYLYAGARIGSQWYFYSGGSWLAWTGGRFPSLGTVETSGPMVFSIARDLNVSGIIGTEVYVGYGQSQADMVDKQKYGLIYTIH
jgi:serine protease